MSRLSRRIGRARLLLEHLEPRLVLSTSQVRFSLDLSTLPEYGPQIYTVQAYQDTTRVAFGILDTGSEAVSFSATDQADFAAQGRAIPIAAPLGAKGNGVGGTIVGDASQPGTILVDGLHAVSLSLNALGQTQVTTVFGSDSLQLTGIRAFVGTATSSPNLPTLSGAPIWEAGKEALVEMHGYTANLSDGTPIGGLSLADVHFVSEGTALTAGANATGPFTVPLTPYAGEGGSGGVSEAPVPVQTDVTVTNGTTRLTSKQFLFDTGAELTVISPALAQALGLDLAHPQMTATPSGVAGAETMPGYVLTELDLPTSDGGLLQFLHVPVFVGTVSDGLDGILGTNLYTNAVALLYDPGASGAASVSFTFPSAAPAPVAGGGTSGGAQGGTGVSASNTAMPSPDVALPELAVSAAAWGGISGTVSIGGSGGAGGVPFQTVFLDANNNGQLEPGDPQTVTGLGGSFQFTGLAPGTYTVREVVPGFLTATTAGAAITVSVQAGQTTTITLANSVTPGQGQVALVTHLYDTVLDRAPDPGGLAGWLAQLAGGATPDEIARGIWESAEHRGLEVDSYYLAYLQRAADPAGRAAWVQAFLGGASELQVQLGFLTSAEYQAIHPDDTSFLAALYEDVLGRALDVAGDTAWLQALQSGMSRTQVAWAFLNSEEAHLQLIDLYYANFLGRAPDPVGEQSWLNQLQQGLVSPESMALGFLDSPEFSWAPVST